MTLTTLVPFLRNYRIIVVTGPQRSGTTIAATILAKELRFKVVLEETFREDNLVAFASGLSRRKRAVFQAPALPSIVHLLKPPHIAVVFMLRATSDVIRSEERINWTKGTNLMRNLSIFGQMTHARFLG